MLYDAQNNINTAILITLKQKCWCKFWKSGHVKFSKNSCLVVVSSQRLTIIVAIQAEPQLTLYSFLYAIHASKFPMKFIKLLYTLATACVKYNKEEKYRIYLE